VKAGGDEQAPEPDASDARPVRWRRGGAAQALEAVGGENPSDLGIDRLHQVHLSSAQVS
jgi:hypothetical protein